MSKRAINKPPTMTVYGAESVVMRKLGTGGLVADADLTEAERAAVRRLERNRAVRRVNQADGVRWSVTSPGLRVVRGPEVVPQVARRMRAPQPPADALAGPAFGGKP